MDGEILSNLNNVGRLRRGSRRSRSRSSRGSRTLNASDHENLASMVISHEQARAMAATFRASNSNGTSRPGGRGELSEISQLGGVVFSIESKIVNASTSSDITIPGSMKSNQGSNTRGGDDFRCIIEANIKRGSMSLH